MNLPKLSPRLKKIAELVEKCDVFLDVGTDHAYLPVYLINSGICKTAVASDLRQGPLNRARETARLFFAEEKVDLRLGSGFETVCEGEADVAVVAGMGGVLIGELLENSEKIAKALKSLVLQPMTAVFELRKFLYENGYTVCEEVLVKEEEKLYHILKVLPFEEKNKKSEAELYFGDKISKNSPFYEEYKERQIKKLETKLFGIKKAKSKNEELKKTYEQTIILLEEIKKF